jgi:hypothetical protein
MFTKWVFLGTPVYSTNKTNHHGITEILLKVALNTITLAPNPVNRTTIIHVYLIYSMSLLEKPKVSEVVESYMKERQKYQDMKKVQGKKGSDREAITLAMLSKFQNKLTHISPTIKFQIPKTCNL